MPTCESPRSAPGKPHGTLSQPQASDLHKLMQETTGYFEKLTVRFPLFPRHHFLFDCHPNLAIPKVMSSYETMLSRPSLILSLSLPHRMAPHLVLAPGKSSGGSRVGTTLSSTPSATSPSQPLRSRRANRAKSCTRTLKRLSCAMRGMASRPSSSSTVEKAAHTPLRLRAKRHARAWSTTFASCIHAPAKTGKDMAIRLDDPRC